jgi:hypothetical protein
MPAATSTLVYDVEDFKVYPVLTDATGASPTFDTAVDVPGISQVTLDPNIVSAELKGDGGKVIGFKSRADRYTLSATYGKLSLDVLEVILGQASTAVSNDFEMNLDTDELPKFRCAFQILDTSDDVGSVTVDLYVCRISGGSLLSQQSDTFGQPTLELVSFSPQNDATAIGKMTFFENATSLPA